MEKGYERLVIIDHARHEVFIEDVSQEDLEKYGGEEEAYIKDNYTFEGEWSWDYIVGITFLPADDKTPREVEPTEWFDD